MCLGMCSGSLGFVLFGHLLTPSFVPENRNATWGYSPPYPLRLWFGALSWTVVWLDGLDYPLLIKRGNGKLQMGVYSWENHRSKWWIFQQTTFDYRIYVDPKFLLVGFPNMFRQTQQPSATQAKSVNLSWRRVSSLSQGLFRQDAEFHV